ncbi:MAG: anthranilate synthase component 1 [bacterium]|jgi:anthranilate synthase component 1
MKLQVSLEEYHQLSANHDYVPLWVEISGDTLTPVRAFQQTRKVSQYSYLLESVQQDEKRGRYSFIGLDPLMVFQSNQDQITITDDQGNQKKYTGNPIHEIFEVNKKYKPAEPKGLEDYSGGVVGYFGYDMIRHVEDIPNSNSDDLDIPESLYILPKLVVLFDSFFQTIKIICHTPSKSDEEYQKAHNKIQNLLNTLNAPISSTELVSPIIDNGISPSEGFQSNMEKKEFLEIVEKAKKHIIDGDIFQVVLSQRFSTEFNGDAFEVYRTLRRINPSPYQFFLNYPDFQIAGASPEILVKKEGDTLILRPIAGTRKRGKTLEEDQALEDELLNDPKEVAEHMMLVDLGRNDLGRISEFGTVKLTKFKYIENYSHVKHIVTNLESKLSKTASAEDVLPATFPAGTLTGAPKVRAMEVIDDLEVSRRGFYGGTVVNIDFAGNIDACIGIRCVLMKDQKAHIQAGAGVVADSIPELEHKECLNKAAAVMKAVQLCKEGEQ